MQSRSNYIPITLINRLIFLSLLSAMAAPAAAQDTQLHPLPGPEIINSTVDMQANFHGPCILQDSGELNCWPIAVLPSVEARPFNVDFEALNDALNKDITAFSLGLYGNHACAIGRESGVACVDDPLFDFEATDLENIPEPDAKYIALSKLNQSENIWVFNLITEQCVGAHLRL